MKAPTIQAERVRGVRLIGALFLVDLAALASAQQTDPLSHPNPPATGTVVGNVTYTDSRLPVRFAEIRLVPTHTDAELHAIEDQANSTNPPKPYLIKILGTTGMDGSFRMENVPTGDYYAGALLEGYAAPGAVADMFAPDDQLKPLLASLPKVHVVAGQVANVSLTLRRVAAISGRVQFADGSPAVGVQVSWELAGDNPAIESNRLRRFTPMQETMQNFQYYTNHNHWVTTDEQGRYRIFGLSPGDYILETTISSQLTLQAMIILNNGGSPEPSRRVNPYPEMTVVYAPGVFRRSEARVLQIRGSEEVTNANLKIDPSGLHVLRGRVLAGEDHHVPTQGIVRLKEDGAEDVGRFVMIEEDGSFQIDYLSPGRYTLQVNGLDVKQSTANPPGGLRISRQYQLAKRTIAVGTQDVVVDDVVLALPKPGEKLEYPQ